MADDNHTHIIEILRRIARVALRDKMSDYSEDRWCAGWLDGLEYSLWSLVKDGAVLDVYDERCNFREMAEAVGGWFHWPEMADGPEFVEMSEWLQIYEERMK